MTCLFFSQFSFAKVIKDDHFVTHSNEYSWEKVCEKMVGRKSPLIEYHSKSKLDCMGTKVKVIKYCESVEAGNPYLTRGFVSKEKNKVICQSGSRVILKWQCEGKKDPYCKDIDIGCFLFKEKLARRLKLVHKSITDEKFLNFYFDTQKNESKFNI